MNQFLGKDDGKWHITITVNIPRVHIRNQLNYRIYSTTTHGGVVTKDPSLVGSNCSFSITPDLLGKNVFFNMSFLKASIANVDVFRFGLCDEMFGWHHSTFLDIKNEYHVEPLVMDVQPPTSAISTTVQVPISVSVSVPQIITAPAPPPQQSSILVKHEPAPIETAPEEAPVAMVTQEHPIDIRQDIIISKSVTEFLDNGDTITTIPAPTSGKRNTTVKPAIVMQSDKSTSRKTKRK